MSQSISLHEVVIQTIMNDLEQSFISTYEIGAILYNVVKNKEYKSRPLRLKSERLAERSDVNRVISKLLAEKVLITVTGLPKHLLAFNPRYQVEKENPNKLICQIDPFLYISHLSAMTIHGLTDRLPTTIFCTTLTPSFWTKEAEKRMQKELEENYKEYVFDTDLPILKRTRFVQGKFIGMPVEIKLSSSVKGAFKNFQNGLRVSTIGKTFLDMIRVPSLCGGIAHVMDVYEAHAETYLDLIIDEINQHGTQIEKARAGYLFEEICEIKNANIDEWLSTVQRGGSRKLDPQAPFESEYSEKWGLSLNV